MNAYPQLLSPLDLGFTTLKNRVLMLVCVSSAFRTMTQTGLLTFLPVYLAYEMGYSPVLVGVCLTVLQVAGFVASPIAGHLSDKMGRKRIVMAPEMVQRSPPICVCTVEIRVERERRVVAV